MIQEHRTTDTKELAPYPNMDSDDLKDFEYWAENVEKESGQTLKAVGYGIIGLSLYFLVTWI